MLITINREVYINLPSDVRTTYVYSALSTQLSADESDTIPLSDYSTIVKSMIYLINKNELILEKYTWEEYIESKYPAYYECSGYCHITGKYAVAFFDISADDISELEYSFNILEVL